MNTDSFSLSDFLGGLSDAYTSYNSVRSANATTAAAGNAAVIQQQIALAQAQAQAQSAATTKNLLMYGLIAAFVLGAIYIFKKVS